jgi:rRNA maturation RNase YbeY
MADANPSVELLGAPAECPAGVLEPFVSEVLGLCGRPHVELCISFVDDEKIRRLNREYRGIDEPTDVLSFPIESDTPEGVHYLGDVAVSLPTAVRQAEERGHSLREELLILVAHGIIHLCGHDHETDSGEMLKLEQRARDDVIPRYCE